MAFQPGVDAAGRPLGKGKTKKTRTDGALT